MQKFIKRVYLSVNYEFIIEKFSGIDCPLYYLFRKYISYKLSCKIFNELLQF